LDTGQFKDKSERGGSWITVLVGKIRVVVRETHAQQKDGDDVKEDDTPKRVADGAGDGFRGVSGFGGSNTNNLSTHEGETG
jgi:hypothetical protein